MIFFFFFPGFPKVGEWTHVSGSQTFDSKLKTECVLQAVVPRAQRIRSVKHPVSSLLQSQPEGFKKKKKKKLKYCVLN